MTNGHRLLIRIREAMMKKSKRYRCRWTIDEDGNWHTDCDHIFCFNNDEGPIGNLMKFCCYCGLLLKECGL